MLFTVTKPSGSEAVNNLIMEAGRGVDHGAPEISLQVAWNLGDIALRHSSAENLSFRLTRMVIEGDTRHFVGVTPGSDPSVVNIRVVSAPDFPATGTLVVRDEPAPDE